MIEKLTSCTLCPYECKVNRLEGMVGKCHASDKVKVALVSLHQFEEPCISGGNGSGTIFFSYCNFNCKFCQNYEISQQGMGQEISVDELANLFLKQEEEGANNINLVTPVMYVYHIIEALKIARKKGFCLPVIYNSNGYESIETLKILEGYIDIYLPDLKYYNQRLAKKYSNCADYFNIATKAMKEMERQVGPPVLDDKGIIQKGLIIRHLVLPNYLENTKHVLKWIKENIDPNVYVSVMAQYFPSYQARQDPYLNRKLTKQEYQKIETYLYTLKIENGYLQELGEHEEEYVPDFKNQLT